MSLRHFFLGTADVFYADEFVDAAGQQRREGEGGHVVGGAAGSARRHVPELEIQTSALEFGHEMLLLGGRSRAHVVPLGRREGGGVLDGQSLQMRVDAGVAGGQLLQELEGVLVILEEEGEGG